MKLRIVIVGILFLFERTFCLSVVSVKEDKNLSQSVDVSAIRLPSNLNPVLYDLELTADFENALIEGREEIEVICSKDTNRIILHQKNITIDEASVEVRGEAAAAEKIPVVGHEYDVAKDFYIISLGDTLRSGHNYIVSLKFTSVLGDNLVGFYRGTYEDAETKEKRWFAATQFEPTYARRAFPSFDEPNLKSQFIVSLGRSQNMTTISNMPLEKSEPIAGKPGYIMDRYKKSVPMSTYLVAFIVSDFAHLKSDAHLSKAEFRVWARKDLIEQAKYAQDVGPRILTAFDKYFGIDYPLPKQDMIALPDFKSGAMENWGLVTYRESSMLFDPKVSSVSSKKSVVAVIAHELAHQWFGNLVTMKWWSQLWLNEGFASYVEYLGVEEVEPGMKILDSFPIDEIHEVFRLDGLESSHPVSVEVAHPDDISQSFDSISYKKGASVIRMMSHFLTESTFRKGLSNYLRTWKYNNTIQDDLWTSLTEQAHADGTLPSDLTVKTIMDSWTLQKGFPVVHVERDYENKSATFSQKKFQLQSNSEVSIEDNTLWWIPISYASKVSNRNFSQTSPSFWLSETSASKEIPAAQNDWFIVNPQQTGYYRVNYDKRNWELLEKQLKENYRAISTINRAQILNDVLSLAQASILSYEDAMNIADYVKDDDEYIPWEAFSASIGYLKNRMKRSEMFGMYKSFIRSLVKNQYEKVGFFQKPNETLPQIQHRVNIVALSCSVDLEECVNQAQSLYTTYTKNQTENPIPKNLRQTVYCTVIRQGGEKEWEFLWNMYMESNVAHEKNVILAALGCARENWILNRYLNKAMTPESGVRKQDSIRVFRTVAANEVGCDLMLTFMADRWPELDKYFGKAGLRSFSGVLTAISKQLQSPFDLKKLHTFKETHNEDLRGLSRALDQAQERILGNIKWTEHNMPSISQWFHSKLNVL